MNFPSNSQTCLLLQECFHTGHTVDERVVSETQTRKSWQDTRISGFRPGLNLSDASFHSKRTVCICGSEDSITAAVQSQEIVPDTAGESNSHCLATAAAVQPLSGSSSSSLNVTDAIHLKLYVFLNDLQLLCYNS